MRAMPPPAMNMPNILRASRKGRRGAALVGLSESAARPSKFKKLAVEDPVRPHSPCPPAQPQSEAGSLGKAVHRPPFAVLSSSAIWPYQVFLLLAAAEQDRRETGGLCSALLGLSASIISQEMPDGDLLEWQPKWHLPWIHNPLSAPNQLSTPTLPP